MSEIIYDDTEEIEIDTWDTEENCGSTPLADEDKDGPLLGGG